MVSNITPNKGLQSRISANLISFKCVFKTKLTNWHTPPVLVPAFLEFHYSTGFPSSNLDSAYVHESIQACSKLDFEIIIGQESWSVTVYCSFFNEYVSICRFSLKATLFFGNRFYKSVGFRQWSAV